MADGLNRTTLLGNLGADPELRMTSNGTAVLTLRLATNESYLDRNKVRQEVTEWHTVVVWGKRAEALAKLLSKGERLYIEGSSRTQSWDDKKYPDLKRYRTQIVARNVILCGSSRGAGAPPAGADQYDHGPPTGDGPSTGDDFGPPPGGDDDIPF